MDATHVPAQRTEDDAETAVGRCALYRFYAADDTLLYIGITQELPTRLRVHDRKQPWYYRVARVTVEQHDTRELALAAEAEAIRAEKPLYNVVHNWGTQESARTRTNGPRSRHVRSEDDPVITCTLEGRGKYLTAKFVKTFSDGRVVYETRVHNDDGWRTTESITVTPEALNGS